MSAVTLAFQITGVEIVHRGVSAIKNNILEVAKANDEVRKSFDKTLSSFRIAAIAGFGTKYVHNAMKPAVGLAGDLQKEMLGVRAEMMGGTKDAATLKKELAEIKKTAFGVQAWTPFDQTQIVSLQKQLIKAGADYKDVTGQQGAAAAAAALATYDELDPVMTGNSLISIGTPFGIAADQYMVLADAISRAASASTTGTAEIVEAAKYAAGPMALMGKDVKELMIMSAMLAQVGIEGSMAGVSLKEFYGEAAKQKDFRDVNGNLKETAEIVAILKNKLAGKGEAEQATILGKVFGERGSRVALALLREGKGSFDDMLTSFARGIALQEKLAISMKGYNKQMESFRGNARSVFATVFTPALAPLTKIMEMTNSIIGNVGKFANENEWLNKAIVGLGGAAELGGIATTIGFGTAGVLYFSKMLKGMGGWGGLLKGVTGTFTGIAEGKVVQAATGVTPVFVTNWPGGGGGIAPGGSFGGGSGGSAAGGAVAGSLLSKSLPVLRMLWLPALALGAELYGINEFRKYSAQKRWEAFNERNKKRYEEFTGAEDKEQYFKDMWNSWGKSDRTGVKNIPDQYSNITIVLPENGSTVTKSDGPATVNVDVKRGTQYDLDRIFIGGDR